MTFYKLPRHLRTKHFAVKIFVFLTPCLSAFSYAQPPSQKSLSNNDINVIKVIGQRLQKLEGDKSFALGKTSEPDLANWLASIPGANINSNGPITGIAQYRGLYGDRISVNIDGHTVIGAGPNAMDTPLSYSTPLIVESMTVYSGITPVSAAMNTLGGAINVQMRKAETSNSKKIQVAGDLQAGYRSNNNANTLSAAANFSRNKTGLLIYGNAQTGDSMVSASDITIEPTSFDKTQLGGDFRYYGDNSKTGLSYHYTDTQDSGTPALPMDIEYIKSHKVNLDGDITLGGWETSWLMGYFDADHGMTNFLMRANNDPTKYRRNNATAETLDFKVSASKQLSFGDLLLGLDGYSSEHNSVITNPNNAMFKVVNFNGVTDDRVGFFAEFKKEYGATNIELGARLKNAKADAGEVGTSMAMMENMNTAAMPNMDMPAMPNMGALAQGLMDRFNQSSRYKSTTNIDTALSAQTKLSDSTSLYIGLGQKNRAPSYQELYLWMPMESTGGLADGNVYIGNLDLDPEQASQINLGLNFQSNKAMLAPHIYYQRIHDYIQGTPVGMKDMYAQMLGNMMSEGKTLLKFNNVDAELYGMDMNGHYRISNQFQVSGIVSFVRGKRRDIDDFLYRIAPLNGQLSLSYLGDKLSTNLTAIGVSRQEDVSSTNNEQATAGYGLVNIDLEYVVNSGLSLRAGIDNILDKEYQNHLGGYNRVKQTGIPVMARLPGEGLSAWGEVSYRF